MSIELNCVVLFGGSFFCNLSQPNQQTIAFIDLN